MNDEYTKRLEDIIKQMLSPVKRIPLKLVIETISGHKVLPHDQNDEKDRKVLENLIKVATLAGHKINEIGIERGRPNEVGNDIEPFVKKAFYQIVYIKLRHLIH